MIRLNKYIFVEVCGKDFDKYRDIINTIKQEYFQLLHELSETVSCRFVRILTHKLIGVVASLKGTNSEITYILKNILDIPKTSHDFYLYKYYIDQLIHINMNNVF